MVPNWIFSRRFSKKNADYSSDFFFFSRRFSKKNADYSSDFFLRPTNWQIL